MGEAGFMLGAAGSSDMSKCFSPPGLCSVRALSAVHNGRKRVMESSGVGV